MVNEIILTVNGRLTADPELRYLQNGQPVANFTIASNARRFDKTKNEFVDEEATFLRCSVFGMYAENVAASLTKGTAVLATGRYKQRQYEKDGVKRTSTELQVDEIGATLRFATAIVSRTGNTGGGQPSGYQQDQQEAWATPPATFQDDAPWATPGGSAPGTYATPGAGQGQQPISYGDDTPF